jgi:hypothetical protein
MANEFANATILSTADDLVYAEAIEAVVREELGNSVVIAPFALTKNLAGTGSHVWSSPIWTAMTTGMAAVNEIDDLALEAVSTGQNSVTASEAGVMTGISDKLRVGNTLGDEIIVGVGQVLGRDAARYIEDSLAALFASFNGSTAVGTSGSPMVEDDIQTALYLMELHNAKGPLVCFLHPRQANDLRKDMFINAVTTTGGMPGHVATLNTEAFGAADPTNGYWTTLYGVPIYVTAACPADSTTNWIGWLGRANYAFGLAYHWLGRTELERDASGRLTEVVVTSDFGVGELHDQAGVPIETDYY